MTSTVDSRSAKTTLHADEQRIAADVITQAAAGTQAESNPQALKQAISTANLDVHWCTHAGGSAYRSRHTTIMNCALSVHATRPQRFSIEAWYRVELDNRETDRFPLPKKPPVRHWLRTTEGTIVQTYGNDALGFYKKASTATSEQPTSRPRSNR